MAASIFIVHVMQFVPWQNISDWNCTACGYCCKLYSVVLNFPEWLRLVKTFGAETTVAGLNRFYIKRADDGACTFLCHFGGSYLCGLQHMKPVACKLWPFKILSEPKYGHASRAQFNYRGKTLFVYADPMCSGLRYGAPTWEFTFSTLREFADIALGMHQAQCKTTSNLSYGRLRGLRWSGFW